MVAQTGSSYISGTMTDSIEIPTTNSGFSMMTSSIKVWPTDFDIEPLPEIETAAKTVYIIMFSFRSSSQSLGVSLFKLDVAENPIFAVGIVILPLVVQEI